MFNEINMTKMDPTVPQNTSIIPCGIKEISLESENNNKFVPKKLDNPVRKKPNPPKLTVIAQNTLLKRLDPVKQEVIPDFASA